MVIFTMFVVPPNVTTPAPVVAIITLSPATGAVPPTQVAPVVQVPPAAVLVRVAAFVKEKVNNKKTISNRRIVFDGFDDNTVFFPEFK